MEIDSQALTTCEVAPDGEAISLGFVDTTGNPATIRLSIDEAGALLMTLPGLIDRALQTRFADQSLRYAYPARVMDRRAIVRSGPRHRHAADGGRI